MEKRDLRKTLTFVLAAILLVVIAVLVIQLIGITVSQKETSVTGTVPSKTLGKWQEGVITYNGQKYEYNNKLKTYLFLGIDKDGKVETTTNFTEGGQSDAIFLMVVNPETKVVTLMSIHRNTMTEVTINDAKNNSLGTMVTQLCVQHGFGDGAKISCSRTVTAVEKLMENCPISGYISMNMGAIADVNDAIGGVEVEILEDLERNGVVLKKGEEVTLTGEEAYAYIRSRDTEEDDSASARLERQEQYIQAYLEKLMTLGSAGMTELKNVYNKTEAYICTDLAVVDVLSDLSDYTFDTEHVYTVPGEVVTGGRFEEYVVDKEKLHEVILEVFYNKK